MRAGAVIIGICLLVQGICASDKAAKLQRASFGATAGWTYLLGLDKYARDLIKSPYGSVYSIYGAYRALPSDSSLYDEASVSYKHLTLPTRAIVYISVVSVS